MAGTVRGSGAASAYSGGYANSGVQVGDVYVGAGRPVAVSGYLHQVRALAAAEFVGRERELAQLAAFCLASGPGGYWRWLAEPWAGKSALLAELVLHPPDGVDVVAFFITSRYAGQADATAFCAVVQRQLYALLGEAEPPTTPHTRDEMFRLALDRAAQHCAEQGRRLLLVIDGLDEDRGVRPEGDSHSIAALLPRNPPHGLRVVLAGRPYPPVPCDVPPGHPLRTTDIDHLLEPSAAAQVIRQQAEVDLRRLRREGGLGWELVGLTVATGGGLSERDFVELSASAKLLVEDQLSTVNGRSFQWRAGQWDQDGPGVYLFAHEGIRCSAEKMMTEEEIATHRTRLHRWADVWRVAGWPAETPEYLLQGYGRLLSELGDVERLVDLVTDAGRRERMWEVAGSDLEAVGELDTAMGPVVTRGRARGDLAVADALRIAVCRDGMRGMTSSAPAGLIACWARLGHADRALGLARSHRTPGHRVASLIAVARALAAKGSLSRAMAIVKEVGSAADRDKCRAGIALALIESGRFEEGRQLACTLASGRAEVLTALLEALATNSEAARTQGRAFVETVVREAMAAVAGMNFHIRSVDVLAALAAPLDLLGDRRQATELLRRAERVVDVDRDARQRAEGYASLVRSAADAAGHRPHLRSLQQAAVAAAGAMDLAQAEWALPSIVGDLTRGGFRREAWALLETAKVSVECWADAVARIGEASAEAGDIDGAMAALSEIAAGEDQWTVWRAIARRLVKDGRVEEAVQVVRQHGSALGELMTTVPERVMLMVGVADVLGEANLVSEASDMVRAATALSRSGARTAPSGPTVARIAAQLGRLGHHGSGARLIRYVQRHDGDLNEPFPEERGWLGLAVGLNAVGCPDEAESLLVAEMDHARALPHPAERTSALANAAEAFAGIGNCGAAERIADELFALGSAESSSVWRSWFMDAAARAYLAAERVDRCIELIEGPEDVDLALHLPSVIEALVDRGELEAAELVVAVVPFPLEHEGGVAELARGAAAAGDFAQAETWLAEVESAWSRERTTPHLAVCLADKGQWSAARALADVLTDPTSRGRALAMIAARRGPSPEGRLLLAEALALAPWDELVEEFATVAPELVPLLVDLVLADEEPATDTV